MYNPWTMGLNAFSEIAAVCPNYDTVFDPACEAAELIWLKYLAYARIGKKELGARTLSVRQRGQLVSVEAILKDEPERSHGTYLVLRSTDQPALEGVILSQDPEPLPTRPFCVFARYDIWSPKRGESLKKAVEKVGLTYYVEDGLTHILSRLLLLNKLTSSLGSRFWPNLGAYGAHALETGLVKAVWEDD